MKNMKMWPKNTRPIILGENSDELVKKKFEKATREGIKMKYFCLLNSWT